MQMHIFIPRKNKKFTSENIKSPGKDQASITVHDFGNLQNNIQFQPGQTQNYYY